MPDFRTRLATLGLRQSELRRWIETLTGRQIHKSTTSKLARGQHQPSPEMEALLITLEKHPAVLAEIKGCLPEIETVESITAAVERFQAKLKELKR